MANAIYANALASSRTTKMLGIERLLRMTEAGDLSDALKILAEVGFGGDGKDVDEMVENELNALYDFVRGECPSKRLKKFFLIANDYHNAEVFIKGKYLPINTDDLTLVDGLMDKAKMKTEIMIDRYSSFPNSLQNALRKCDEDFAFSRATGLSVSSALKKALYIELKDIAGRNKLLLEIFNVKADFANVSVALRSRDESFTKEHKVVGGYLSERDLQKLATEPLETLREEFKNKGKIDVVSAIEAVMNGKPLATFEREAEGFAVKKLKIKKYETSGIYPFVYYCYSKLAEIENVRIILTGKSAKASPIDIKGRLRETYEG